MALSQTLGQVGSRPSTRRPRLRRELRRPGLTLVMVVICVILLFPMYWLLVSSLEPMSKLLSLHLSLVPNVAHLDGSVYVSTFRSYALARWLLNSLAVTVGTVALSMLVAVPAGYSLSRLRSGASGATAGLFFLVSRAVPGTFLVIPFFVMAARVHLISSLWSVMIANSALVVPFAAWVLKGFFDAIPDEIEQAAYIDGCGLFEALRRVVLPLSKPGIAAAAIYAAIAAWSDYLFAATLLVNPSRWTVTVGAVSMVTDQKIDWNGLMATGIVSCGPMLLVFILLERYLVSGLSAGAVVG